MTESISLKTLTSIRQRQQASWRDRQGRLVEELATDDERHQLSDDDFWELVLDEIRLRGCLAEKLSLVEYQRRFPNFIERLQALPDFHDTIDVSLSGTVTGTPQADCFAATVVPSTGSQQSASVSGRSTGANSTDFGEYEILGEIARGGMGVVYRARQKRLNRIVALKMILAGNLASELDIKRFYTEAEAAARLDHPGIVPIYEVNRTNDQHYYAMGFVDGPSLSAKIGGKPSAPRAVAELLIEIADAVEYAHQHGIIHRDLKPQNILLTMEGHPKITDFGLAKRLGNDSDLTSSGQILGTPNYMAPEQAAGKIDEIGPLADVYALGGILYCMLVGKPPYQGKNLADTLYQVQFQELTPPNRLNPRVHRDVATICVKALAKSPASRYSSASAFADDLRRFCNGEPILARREGWMSSVVRRARRNRIAVLSLLAVALVVVFAGWLVWRSSDAYQLASLNQQLEAELDSEQVTSETIAKLDGLVQSIARVAPETEALARKRIAEKLVSYIQQQINRPRLSSSEIAEIERQIEIVDQRSTALAPSLRDALQRRRRVWETVFDVKPPFADVSRFFPTLQVSMDGQGLARVALPSSLALAAVPSRGNVTFEAEFPAGSRREPVGLVLAGRQGHTQRLSTLCFNSDGSRLLTGSAHPDAHQSGELRLWDVERGAMLASFRLPLPGEPLAVVLPEHQEAVVAIIGRPNLWRLHLGEGRWEEWKAYGSDVGIQQLEASSTSQQIATAAIKPDAVSTIDLWNVTDRDSATPRNLGTSPHPVSLLRFHTNGQEVAWYAGHLLQGIFLTDAQPKQLLDCANVRDLSSDLRTALVSSPEITQLWDVASSRMRSVGRPGQNFYSSAFAPDNQSIVFPDDINSVVFSVASGKSVFELRGHGSQLEGTTQRCRFSNNGKWLATAAGDGSVAVWNTATRRQIARLGEGGYFFLFHSAGQAPGRATLELRRNNIVLRRQEVPFPDRKLRLTARREGQLLTIQLNDLSPVEFRDAFPLPSDDTGRFGLVMASTDRVLHLQARHQGQASNPTSLEAADELYAVGNYSQALDLYEREVNSTTDLATIQESNYKRALCLLAVDRTSEADELLSSLAIQPGDRWPPHAGCQLWLRRLREKNSTQAEQLLENLTSRFRFEELAGMIPEDVRAEIIHEYGQVTVGANLFVPNANRTQQAERAVAVEKLLFQFGGEWRLLRAYHGSGQTDLALRYAESLLSRSRSTETPVENVSGCLQEYLWLLRLHGRAAEALTLLDGWPANPQVPLDCDRALLASDRVRLLDALGRSVEAEKDAEKARLTLSRYMTEGESAYMQMVARQSHKHLGLMLGILRDRRGDTSGAVEVWRSEIGSGWEETDLNMNLMYDHIRASLAGEMTLEQSRRLFGRILATLGDSGKVFEVSGLGTSMIPAFAELFRSARGRQAAYDVVFRAVPLPVSVRLYPQLAVFETVRRSLLRDDSPAGHEPILWEACTRMVDLYSEGKLGGNLVVPLVLSWKGTNNFLGWGAAAPALSPTIRGPIAFLMGLRYTRLGRPKDAIEFFRQAEADGGADSPLGREAREERVKLEKL